MESIGLGFAGVGLLGQSMIERVPNVPELHLAAVQDANVELAMAVAQRHGSPWHGQRFEDLLDVPSVEAVVISTPNALHVPQALAALRAGKHVLVQKPLATSAADARAAVDVAAAYGGILFVDYSYRLLETAATLRTALPEIGSVSAVSAAFHNLHGPGPDRPWFIDPKLSGGGALIDLGVHMLDFVLWLFGPADVQLEQAVLDRPPGSQVEHSAQMLIRLDELPLKLEVGWNTPLPMTEIHVTLDGSNGQLRWHNVGGSFTHFRTELNGRLLIDREMSLRENTLRAFAAALASGSSPPFDTRVYDLLDQALAR